MPSLRRLYKRARALSAFARKASASKATRIARKALKRANDGKETKSIDVVVSGPIDQDQVSVNPLTNIAVGDSESTRDGWKITLKSIELAYNWTIHSSAVSTTVRTTIVQDMRNTGTQPDEDEIYELPNASNTVLSPWERSFKGRFKILYDKVDVLNVNGKAGVYHKKKIYKMNKTLRYTGDSASNYQAGACFLIFSSNDGTNLPSVSSVTRVNYEG